MIAVEHLSVQFGGKYLFRDASFTISGRDRGGIVGGNGAGKSTLLKIIYGLMTPESGVVQFPRGYTLGYLPQEVSFDDITLNRSALSEVMLAREELVQYQDELDQIQILMETETDHMSDKYAKALDRFGELHHLLESGNAYSLEADAARILNGLGFSDLDLYRPIKEFSGGWQMRVLLAKLLLQKPNALLLDEPTNHLDLASIMWLEQYLYSYEGVVLIVSHDRVFLNAIATKIVSVSPQRVIEVFTGNYDKFEEQLAEREVLRAAQAATQNIRRKELESFVERFRYKASKAKQAQSRVKMLERMERIELVDKTPFISFQFPEARASGRTVFEIENGAKSFIPNKYVFSGCELRVERGDRIAFLGRNGEGKTTLGKILAGVEPLSEGELKIGHNVTLAYYAQHVADSLDPNATVFETIDTVARSLYFNSQSKINYTESQIRSLLGSFLFRGDDVIKPVKVLSGGEKSRLALAKLLLTPSNTLILDEPTNHLDMRSKEVLKQALLGFEGTIIVISHDRDFLRDLTERVITFGDGKVKEYYGDLETYLIELAEKERAEIAGKKNKSKNDVAEVIVPEKDRKRSEADERNAKSKKLKPLKDELTKIEKKIAPLEAEKQKIEDAMFEPTYYDNTTKVQTDTARLSKIKTDLEALYYSWTEISEKLEGVEV